LYRRIPLEFYGDTFGKMVVAAADKSLSFAESFVLSGVAAVVSKTCAAPLERIKLLVQNQGEMIKSGRLDRPYNGIADCAIRTFKHEGILPFWRGNFTNCIRYFPTQALNFAFKDKVRVLFNPKDSDSYLLTLGKNVASGGMAGAMSLSFVYSLDFAQTRLANDAKSGAAGGRERQFNGLRDVYAKTYRSDGFRGLYRGFVISCCGIVFYRGCYFGFYDTLKPILLGHDAGLGMSFLLGYAVTVCSEIVSYPIDTVRRRLMMTSGAAVKYDGAIDCAKQIALNEGPAAFMRGAGANILRGVAGAGVLAGFDSFKNAYILHRNERRAK
jgi:solute carrier family 25 (mitochondrial adenine nucleotide translocator), member 4/5/6/31